jgi:prolyl-tRNA editing enzyme YbaK/EbsC (Cys-tRNA(Pro) deacylase)
MKTPATEYLSLRTVPCSEHLYEYVEHGGTEVPSRALNVPEHYIVKTLVMEDEERKPLPVFAERSIRGLGEIYINGGRRGLLLKIRPADLQTALPVTWVDVAL